MIPFLGTTTVLTDSGKKSHNLAKLSIMAALAVSPSR